MTLFLFTYPTLKVGFLEGAAYPDTGISIALVAASNNYGTKTIPARPFFTNMVKEKSPGWPEKIAATLKFTKYDVDRTLGITGEGIVDGNSDYHPSDG